MPPPQTPPQQRLLCSDCGITGAVTLSRIPPPTLLGFGDHAWEGAYQAELASSGVPPFISGAGARAPYDGPPPGFDPIQQLFETHGPSFRCGVTQATLRRAHRRAIARSGPHHGVAVDYSFGPAHPVEWGRAASQAAAARVDELERANQAGGSDAQPPPMEAPQRQLIRPVGSQAEVAARFFAPPLNTCPFGMAETPAQALTPFAATERCGPRDACTDATCSSCTLDERPFQRMRLWDPYRTFHNRQTCELHCRRPHPSGGAACMRSCMRRLGSPDPEYLGLGGSAR